MMKGLRTDSGLGETLFWIFVAVITVAAQLLRSRKTPRPTSRSLPVPIREPGSPADELREFLEKLQRGEGDVEREAGTEHLPTRMTLPPPVPQRSTPMSVPRAASGRVAQPTRIERQTVPTPLQTQEVLVAAADATFVPPSHNVKEGMQPEVTQSYRSADETLRTLLRRRESLQRAVLFSELLGVPVGFRRFGMGAGSPPSYWV